MRQKAPETPPKLRSLLQLSHCVPLSETMRHCPWWGIFQRQTSMLSLFCGSHELRFLKWVYTHRDSALKQTHAVSYFTTNGVNSIFSVAQTLRPQDLEHRKKNSTFYLNVSRITPTTHMRSQGKTNAIILLSQTHGQRKSFCLFPSTTWISTTSSTSKALYIIETKWPELH